MLLRFLRHASRPITPRPLVRRGRLVIGRGVFKTAENVCNKTLLPYQTPCPATNCRKSHNIYSR